jgi:hypothetical protein
MVQLVGPGGQQRKNTDGTGQYSFAALTPGTYLVRVIAKDFSLEEKPDFAINGAVVLDVQLRIETASQVVSVEAEADRVKVSIDPDSNASAIVIGKKELDSLSDDPDELASQLQALAGPGAGPQGGQIYTDGFAGSPPPKSSIREIRINSNPFSSEYDQPGFGRIEILTKPGTDVLHGQFSNQYNNENFNSRSPLLQASSLPPYKNLLWGGSIGGPIRKDKSSFTFDFNRRDITENAFIIGTNLSSSLTPQAVNQAVLQPQKFTSFVPRFDFALGPSTLTIRYQDSRNELDNQGIGNFTLPDAAYNQKTTERSLQVTESALVKPTLINETRFQYSRNTRESIVAGESPALIVQDAFTNGGARVGDSHSIANRLELTNLSILSHKTHTLKWGARLRQSFLDDTSVNNFNGTFTFFGGSGPLLDNTNQPISGTSVPLTALQVYQRTLLLRQNGFSSAQIRAAGGGASLFSINAGVPLTHISQSDVGVFFNDDWKSRPNITLSYGLRYEAQTNIHIHNDWSPRLGIAWGLGNKANPKTVLRGGFGLFFNRVQDQTILNSIRYNGTTQQSYQLSNPDFFPNLPSLAFLATGLQPQNIQLLSPTLRAEQVYGINIGVDQQVNKYLRFSANYFNIRGVHNFRQRDVNAPIPGTDIFPYGDSTVRMMTESSGHMFIQQAVIQPTLSYKKITLTAFYGLFWARADFQGLAADPYNLHAEWAPAFGDARQRLNLGPLAMPLPFKISVNALLLYASPSAYNITTGLPDPSGDGAAVQRPALLSLPAAACTGGTLIYQPQFGCFDLAPAPGTPTISKNSARGPSNMNMQFRVARSWGFGKKELPGARPGIAGPGPGPGVPPGVGIPMKYNLTLSLTALNPLNHPSFSNPDSNLSSPLFGKPLTMQNFFFPGGATYNRKVTMQMQVSF